MEIMDKSKYLMPENSGYHIYAFMRNSFNLTSNELTVYAVIFGFSQGGQGCFFGSREYLSACTGANVRTINRVLSSLTEKRLILKKSSITSHGITNIYTVNMEKVKEATKKPNFTKINCPETKELENQNGETNCPEWVGQNVSGVGQNVSGVGQNVSGGETNCPTYYYIKENIEDTLSCPTAELDQENVMAEEERERVPYTSSSKPKKQEFTPPTLEQVLAYIEEKKLNTDGEEFYDYYAGVGWISGKKKIVDWKAILRQWAKKHQKEVLTRTSYGYAPVEFNNF